MSPHNLFERYQALGDEPLYCEGDPAEVFYKGSDDEDYDSSWERKWACERAAANFLDGSTTSLLSARLRGPFSKASGWTNPWRSKSARITKPISSASISKSTTQRKTSKQANQQKTTSCYLPSPISLDNKVSEPHRYLDEDDVARVEDWRTSVDHGKSQPDVFWAPSNHPSASRKRQAKSTEWLKRTQKRRRTDGDAEQTMNQLSLQVQNDLNRSPRRSSKEDEDSGDDEMEDEEDELQADVDLKTWDAANAATPTRKLATRRGLRQSPQNATSNDDSDDELSRPSATAQRSRVWRTASARSQVSRPGRQISPGSSPSKQYVRGKTAPTASSVQRAADVTGTANEAELPEWETQQDNSFIFRARRKTNAPASPVPHAEQQLSERTSSPLSPAPDEISDFTSLGTQENDAPIDDIVSDSPSPQDSPNQALEAVRNSLRATPESSIIGTSQPDLESSTLVEKDEPESTCAAGDKGPENPYKEHDVGFATEIPVEAEPLSEREPNLPDEPHTVESSDDMDLDSSSEHDSITTPAANGEIEVYGAHQAAHERVEDKSAETANHSTDSPASPHLPIGHTSELSDSSGSVAASPGRASITSNDVQGRVEEQIFLESTHMDDDQPNSTDVVEKEDQTTGMEIETESTASVAVDSGKPTPAEEQTTPVVDKHTQLAISQQTPWQASIRGDQPVASIQLRESQATQSTKSVAFSQGDGSIPPIAQQTPWYQDSPLPPLSRESSMLTASITEPIVSVSFNAQSPWSKSFEQMRAAAHTALSVAGISLSFARDQQIQKTQPAPEDMPEETGSVASTETPSLQTAPSTPGNDAPDAVFADASSSPPEAQLSPSPESDPLDEGFTLKPFSAFRSPSPEKSVSLRRKARISGGRLPSTQSILAAATNPWDGAPRTRKSISWALPEDPVDQEEAHRPGRSSGTSTPSRIRGASPPPEQALADLPTGEKDAFQKHFSAVKMKVKGHSHRILPTASQRVLRSPATTAMAEAFLTADEMARPASSVEDDVVQSIAPVADQAEAGELQDFAVTQEEELDDVDEVLRNLGDFIGVMDIETDIQQAKAGSDGVVPAKQGKGRVSLTSQLDTSSVWERF